MTGKPTFLLIKAAIPATARWVTVHPNGPGTKGQPVLIEPQPDGSAKVIGGAGGSLNHLRIRAVRSEADYKADAEKQRAAKAEEKKAQRARDKAAGILESKTKAKQAVREQHLSHEREFISTVGQALGWDTSALAFRPEDFPDVSEPAMKKLEARHHQRLLAKAKQAVAEQRQRLVIDADARAQAGLGEVPLTAAPDQLSVEDLDPMPTSSGLGYSTDYKARAAAAGATGDEVKAEAEAAMTPEQRAKRIARGETAKMMGEQLKDIKEPPAQDLTTELADIKKSVDLLKAEKKLKDLARQAREAGRKIDESNTAVEPQAFVLQYEADPDLDAKIRQDVDDELRTAATVAFLSEVRRIAGANPEETLGRHVGVGAYNSINALALAVGGDALVDRDVVDVLGIAGAAQVLARRIHADLPDDVADIAEGVQEFHMHRYMEAGGEAMAQAKELMEAAKEIELGEANTPHELAAAQELNAKRREAIGDAQRVLGQAYGELEANAALSVALKRKPPAELQVPMPGLSLEQAITRARAIGLRRGDYSVDTAAGTTFLNVHASGMDRLAKPVSKADVAQVKRNIAIMRGDEDEDGWLPIGVSDRPDLAMDVKPGVAERLARPFAPGPDLERSLKDYIGGRAADGDTPADILADIQSADFFRKAGDQAAYQAALDAVAPLQDADGKQRRAESLADTFDGYADEFANREYGGERSPLNRQKLQLDDVTADALHRALAQHPDGVSAYKQIGELTDRDQRTLRETFYRDVAKESPEAASMRAELEQLEASEPEREVEDMFGEKTRNPEHEDWQQRRDELAGKLGAASLDWNKYAATMRGHERAYEAIQDLIKGRVSAAFAEAHNRLRPGAPVKLGRAVIRQNLNHLDATDHEARDARLARERELVDGLRERVQGRYAAGSVADKLDAARDQREAFEQAQMGFFSSEEEPAQPESKPLAADERNTLGHEAERQIAGLMGTVGRNFKPGQPVGMGRPSMSGGDNYARQRAVKLVEANGRVGLHLGAGSGKTLVSMGAFTHLHGKGKATRGIFAVPSIVQGQFNGDALKFLKPGAYDINCQPGASREERIAAYKNPAHHMVIVTHQALRDDLVHLGATAAGISEVEMRDRVRAMSRDERKAWGQSVMDHHGIKFDFSAVDEGHNLLDRAGKEDSGMSQVIGSLTDNTPNHLSMTADPVRNDDASEVFSALQKIAPDRYRDRDAFMRRYGVDTPAAKDGLRREMARYFYAHSIKPDVKSVTREVNVPLSGAQKDALSVLDKDVASMRLARMGGKVDVEAARRVSPESFEGVPEDQHEEIARGLQDAIGVVRDAAVRKVIDDHPESAKLDEVAKHAKERQGKPGVVFARSRAAVAALEKRLNAEGLRVVTITGSDSAKDKDRKREQFNPSAGAAQADILVASDAASTGLNAQRGQWLLQYDTPSTAMTHAQRRARIDRVGQKNDIELIDLIGDHPSERKARARLERKYGMRDLMSSPLERLDDTGLGYFLKQREAAKLQS